MTKAPSHGLYLFLLRHAKAVPYGKGSADFERPLSERGERDAEKMASLFERQGFSPDKALCSPSVRTRQTLEAFKDCLALCKPTFPEEMYLIGAAPLLTRIRKTGSEKSKLFIIAHSPGIEELALELIDPKAGGDALGLERMSEKFPTGALAVLKPLCSDWKGLKAQSCRLEAFVRPKDLET